MYRIYYTVDLWFTKIKWAYQRVRYGYDERANWDLADYFTPMLQKIIFDIAERGYSYPPPEIKQEKWTQILKQIAFGFGSLIEMDSGYYLLEDQEEYERLNKEYKKGMKLFAKYYRNIWD